MNENEVLQLDHEIELRHLRYFLAVAETLHFTRAAQRLGIAQPPLSQQIRRLETLLGHALFERTTRGVKLTHAGQLLAERAHTTLNQIADDLAQVRRLGRGDEGMLTVGFSGSVMFTRLPAAIEAYRRRFPKVELRLRELSTAEGIAALLAGSLDLALLRDSDPTEGLRLETMLEERFVAVLPAAHPLAQRSQKLLPLKLLKDDPFVLFNRRHGPLAFDRTLACCERHGFRPRIVQDAPQWPTVLRLVAAGLGVSLAPACIATIDLPGAVYRSVDARCRTSIDLAQTARTPTAPMTHFIAAAHKHLGRRRA